MKSIFFYILLFACYGSAGQGVTDNDFNFQDIHLFKNIKTQKMLEVEDGPINKGSRVQQYFAYARNGLTDGYNQQWLIIPAGRRNGQFVFHIINYGFLKYLDSQLPLKVEEGNGGDNQLWVFQRSGSNWLIKSFLAEQFLEIPNGVLNDGAAFSIGPYTGEANQQFILTRYAGQTGPGTGMVGQPVNIMPAYANSKALDATGASVNGTQVTIRDMGRGDIKQQWQFNLNSNYFELRPRMALTKCAAVSGLSMEDDAQTVCWDCVNNPNEKWIIIPVIRQRGKFIFFNRNSGKCLAVAGGNATANGTGIIQHTYNNQENCKWLFQPAR